MKYVVEELVERIRIDKYLASVTDLSRTTINSLIDDSHVLVNDEPVKASYKVKENDVIFVEEVAPVLNDIVPVKMDLDIVFEDEYLLVINKPSGLTVHPGAGNNDNTLVNGLMHYTKNLSDVGGLERLGIVHRLDKDTSGLMLACKNNNVHNILAEGFKNKAIKREYTALLIGEFPHESATIDAPIGRDPKNRKMNCVTDKNSKHAVTNLYVLKRYKDYTLVKCILETGRTHQIRVHTKYIGYPVYNDPVYTNKACTPFGQFLHSSKITFTHPITEKELSFEAELPQEFSDYLNTLEEL